MITKEITQLTSLVTYANVILQGGVLDFDLERSITEYCHGCEFIMQPPEQIAGSMRVNFTNPIKWFNHLKDKEAKQVKLHYRTSYQFGIPDHITVAFVGGGSHWFIEVMYRERSDLYSSGQRGTNQPWKTQFIRLQRGLELIEDSSTSVDEGRDRLNKVLENLVSFCSKFEYTQHWAENFRQSKQTLTEYEPIESDDFIPHGFYSKEARQLLETAYGSWVFGGMGSWNDLAFSGDDHELYSSLSLELYDAICNGIVSCVNQGFQG